MSEIVSLDCPCKALAFEEEWREQSGFRPQDTMRGNPTVEVYVTLEGGHVGRGVAPAGASNASLVREAAAQGACNAVLIKVNQAGTISEAIDTFRAATETGFRSVVSARSGETEDVTISHLAAGLGTGQLKVGSFTRSERMAK